jgi:AraC-like DNA-binding protein
MAKPQKRILSSFQTNYSILLDEYLALVTMITESIHLVDDRKMVMANQRRQIENLYINLAVGCFEERQDSLDDVSEFMVALACKFDIYKIHAFSRAKYYEIPIWSWHDDKDVAIVAGFCSASTFIKKFKVYEGITPGQVRNQRWNLRDSLMKNETNERLGMKGNGVFWHDIQAERYETIGYFHPAA